MGKWALFRNDETEPIEVGFCTPYPIKIGKSVWVGSLSSRTGWTTTEVQEISEDQRSFKTLNNNYRIVPLEEFYKDEYAINPD